MNVYAFDVDGTLEISNGSVKIDELRELRKEGHIVGICGNWQKFMKDVSDWKDIINFFQVGLNKDNFLMELKSQLSKIFQVDKFIMTGDHSIDINAARIAGWDFVLIV